MTTEIELLPLPGGEASSFGNYEVHDNEAMIEYARANVAHNTALLRAEIEALRAELKDYRENGASAVKLAPNSAHWSAELRRLFGDDARTGIEVLEQRHRDSLARAERLAEALRNFSGVLERLAFATPAPNTHTSQLVELAIAMRAAALAQEDRNG